MAGYEIGSRRARPVVQNARAGAGWVDALHATNACMHPCMLPELGALPKNMRSRQDAMGLSEFREDARGFQAPTLASFRPRRCQRHLPGAGPRELQRIPRTTPTHSHFQPPTPVQLTCPARFRAPHASAAIFRSASSPCSFSLSATFWHFSGYFFFFSPRSFSLLWSRLGCASRAASPSTIFVSGASCTSDLHGPKHA